MAAEKSPAFQFYPKEFLTDGNVAGMSLMERGAYITLLCVCWQEISLPVGVDRLANMVGISKAHFAKLWPAISVCFVERDGRLIHPRLEKEREKQAEFRRRQSDRGKASAAAREANRGSTTVPTTVQPSEFNREATGRSTEIQRGGQPKSNSPISDLRKEIPSGSLARPANRNSTVVGADARSKRPIFPGQRLTVFEWQLTDLMAILGKHTDSFNLDAWFDALDRQAVQSNLVIPKRDGGKWLQEKLLEECRRRGLPIAGETEDPYAKFTAAWECRKCGEVHEGTQEQGRLRPCLKQVAS